MEDPKSNVPFDVGKRTFIKLFAFAFISAIYATSLLEFRPALISFWYSQLAHRLWLVIYHQSCNYIQVQLHTIAVPKFSDTMLFGHCTFSARCWQCLETGKVSLHLWVTKPKRRKIIVGVHFRVTSCTVGMHNVMARIGLGTNSFRDVSLGKEIAPLLQWICY